jgi:DNA-binding NtrC family response regulator
MREIETLLRKIADRPLPVLLTGETGTGKEVCARFLHNLSHRAKEPFMAVNCAAIPAELLESEVFGHERGAFSGAQQRHLGYAERARKGTLFLDEVCEMPMALQTKLLRLLEERSFHRVGGQAALPLQARVVCATNRNLADAIRQGHFREDLYYRINTVQVDLPPLRSRPEDIGWLLSRGFEQAADAAGTSLRGIGQLALEAALAHSWPGNARELRNRLERAVALANGPWLMPVDLFPELRTTSAVQPTVRVLPLAVIREAAERRHIEIALRESQGQIGMTCRYLKISRTTLWEKMRRYGIHDPSVRPATEG